MELLVYLLLAAVSAEQVFNSREDVRKNELSTTSLLIPLEGKLLETLKKQNDFVITLGTEMKTEATFLEGVMKNFTDEVINDIKGMNQSEECTKLGIKLVEIELFNSRSKIGRCLMDTVNSIERPNRMKIFEIYDRVRKYGDHVVDAEIEHLINEMNEYFNYIEMTMENLTESITEDSFNCIHEKLSDFNSTMSNSTMLVDRCSEDNDTSTVSSITLQLTESFDLIVSLSEFAEKFQTILMTDSFLSTNGETKMDNKMNEVINVIKISSKNQKCAQLGIDQLFSNRVGSWFESKKCLGEGILHAVRFFDDMLAVPVQTDDLEKIIAQFFNYADDLINGDGILVQNYEMVPNINTLRMFADRLMKIMEYLTASNNCFERNENNFKLSIKEIFAEIHRCHIEYGIPSLV